MKTPIVAIIGLPNTGKSTLFNKILEERKALTYPVAGTTRDRAYGLTSWNGFSFYLVDTAGIINNPNSDLEKNVQKQTAIAKQEADLILLLVDGQTPASSEDLRIASTITQSKTPAILAVNKIDVRNNKTETAAAAYLKLGLGQPHLVSSVNGSGIGDLLDALVIQLTERYPAETKDEEKGLRVAFVGKPNVGKSSLINALLKQERVLVHHEAGTTRSTVEIPFEHHGTKFILLDTAGIKKKWKQDTDVEAAAAFQAIRTTSLADVIFFTIDGSAEITAQDQIVAAQILEAQKSAVIVLNKIDLIDEQRQNHLLDILPDYFPQMWYFPVLFSSSKTGQGLDLLLKFAQEAASAAERELDQGELDNFLEKMLAENMPGKMEDQRAPKIYNLKQLGVKPPTFKMTVNFPAAVATAWKKFFEKQFRMKFGFEGTPIQIKYIKRI
ncbi:MAG TPA: ribosome biogenesis GTPase Der [Patescibacteria group bacterium]|jgi:GTP-binding protein|nr:ribosome biogenesis GTPase Der [Patescibacteria group bacterium]